MNDVAYAKAPSSSAVASNLSSAPRENSTLYSALTAIGEVHGTLNETAEWAERLASVLGGAIPPSASGEGPARESHSLTDAVNERSNALRGPTIRIREALARIERAIGN